MLASSTRTKSVSWRGALSQPGARVIPEEAAIALVHDASTTAVMMATPADLEDFAIGFSLTERIVGVPAEISSLEIVDASVGIEVRLWLAGGASTQLAARRRRLAGATGCGLCGVESLAEALRATPVVGSGLTVRPAEVHEALDELGQSQALWTETRAVHAAALWTPGKGVAFVREDVGRHNALDKTIGAWARRGSAPADVVLLTSRVSVEMVQKAAVAGAQMVIAVSAPTALAVRVAESSGVTLVAVARSDSFEVFTHPDRIAP